MSLTGPSSVMTCPAMRMEIFFVMMLAKSISEGLLEKDVEEYFLLFDVSTCVRGCLTAPTTLDGSSSRGLECQSRPKGQK